MPTIEVPLPGGTAEAYLARPPGGPAPGVLFYVDAIGLRPQVEAMADRIASWGCTVLAPNVFHRAGRAADLAPTEDLRTPGARDRFFDDGASARVAALTPELSNADAPAWLAALRGHAAPGPIAITGYCMGARLAVRTAALLPDDVAAVGGWHGGRLVTGADDSPHRLLGRTRAAYHFGHADDDPAMAPADVAALGEALRAAGLDHVNEVYAGAPHGYTMADTSEHHPGATERHDAALRALLARTLGMTG